MQQFIPRAASCEQSALQSQNISEVALLMRRITQEYDAAQNALTGFASGAARHDFINARLENMSTLHEQLATVIGAEAAITFVAQTCEGEAAL